MLPTPHGLLPVETRFVILTYLAEWQHSVLKDCLTFIFRAGVLPKILHGVVIQATTIRTQISKL
jgi:hypothetical protein